MSKEIDQSVYFLLSEIATMAVFVAELVRQGVTFKIERYDDAGFRIYLLGGF